jgi:hypothetical protein
MMSSQQESYYKVVIEIFPWAQHSSAIGKSVVHHQSIVGLDKIDSTFQQVGHKTVR